MSDDNASRHLSASNDVLSSLDDTQPDASTASATELRRRVDAIEHDAAHLLVILQQVSESLSSRTSAAAQMSEGHVAISRELSTLADQSCDQLQQSWDKFLKQIGDLGQYFNVISALAEKTALVRQQVICLEQQVQRLD